MTNETDNTKRRRRWFQFSLRTLLIVVTLSAIPLAWVRSKIVQGREERAAVAWVRGEGGSVVFPGEQGARSWKERIDEWFGVKVRNVVLSYAHVSDLSPLAKLRNLEWLFLENTQVSDLSPLAELKNLTSLWLSHTPVRDLSPLAELPKLEYLSLIATPLNNLTSLSGLKHLKTLFLDNTQVSDLSPLAELKNLTSLSLLNTQVSEEQVQKLRQALPNCYIVHSIRDEE